MKLRLGPQHVTVLAVVLPVMVLQALVLWNRVAYVDEPLFVDPAAHLADGDGFASSLPAFLPGGIDGVWWQPPLHGLLMAATFAVGGVSIITARLPSAAAAAGLAVIVTSWIARRHGPAAGVICAVAAVSSPFFFTSGALARMDMLCVFFSTVALLGAVTVADGPNPPAWRRAAVRVGLPLFAAVLAHPLGLVAVAALGVTAALDRRTATRLFVLAVVGAFVAVLVWMLLALGHLDDALEQVRLQLERKSDKSLASRWAVNKAHIPLLAFGPALAIIRRRWGFETRLWLVWWAIACLAVAVGDEPAYPLHVVIPSILLLADGLGGWWPKEWSRVGLRNGAEPVLRLATLAALALLVVAEAANTATSLDRATVDRAAFKSRLEKAIEPGSTVVITGSGAAPETYFALRGRNPMLQPLPFNRQRLRARILERSRYVVGNRTGYAAPGSAFTPIATIHAAGTATVIYVNRETG